MEKRKALITGASGQDAILLSRYLLGLNYKVCAVSRRAARPESTYVRELQVEFPDDYTVVSGDITDMSSIISAIKEFWPDEFYNLAAQSHVGLSFKEPISTAQITGIGVLNCLEAIRQIKPDTRFYQASSSEQYGGTKATEQNSFVSGDDIGGVTCVKINENTPFEPRSPYACAKVFAHTIVGNYREAYNIHASCGILFNHESELRKPAFVTRKVTRYVAQLKLACGGITANAANLVKDGHFEKLKLGCLDFARDWGCAKDYIRAMHKMLQLPKGDDYVIATGEVHTGKDLLKAAFSEIGIDDYEQFVELDPEFARPTDVKVLVGDASRAKSILDWEPTRNFEQLIADMVNNDWQLWMRTGEVNE